MAGQQKRQQYRVLNPRDIPEGCPILSVMSPDGPCSWLEGDTLTVGLLTQAQIDALVERGFLEPVSDA